MLSHLGIFVNIALAKLDNESAVFHLSPAAAKLDAARE